MWRLRAIALLLVAILAVPLGVYLHSSVARPDAGRSPPHPPPMAVFAPRQDLQSSILSAGSLQIAKLAYTLDGFNGTLIPGKFWAPTINQPACLVSIPGTGKVFVGDISGSWMSVVNASAGLGVAGVEFRSPPPGWSTSPCPLAYDPVSETVYVGALDYQLNYVTFVVSASNYSILSNFTTPNGPGAAAFDPDNGIMYVSDYRQNTIFEANASTDQLLGTSIHAGGGSGSMIYIHSKRSLYVSNPGYNSITVVNISANDSVSEIDVHAGTYVGPLAYDPVSGLLVSVPSGCRCNLSAVAVANNTLSSVTVAFSNTPADVAFAPESGDFLVTQDNLYYGPGVVVLNGSNLSIVGGLAAGDNPASIVYNDLSREVLVSNLGSSNLTVYGAKTLRTTNPDFPFSENYFGVSLNPRSGQLAIDGAGLDCAASSNLAIVDGARYQPQWVGQVHTGGGTVASTYDARDNRLFIANYCSDNVTALNATSDQIVGSVSFPSGPSSVTYDGASNQVYVTLVDATNLTWFNASSLSVGGTVRVGSSPVAALSVPSLHRLFVANSGSDNVSVLNTTSNQLSPASFVVWGSPQALLYDNLTNSLFVANTGSSNLTVLNDSTGAHVGPGIPVGSLPDALTLDPSTQLVYVANAGGGSVSVVNASNDSLVGTPVTGLQDPRGIVYDPFSQQVEVTSGAGTMYVLVSRLPVESVSVTPSTIEQGGSIAISASAEGGFPPYSFSYEGLPPGCSSSNSTVIACQPARAGNYTIRGEVSDARGYPSFNATHLDVTNGPHFSAVSASPSELDLGQTTIIVASVSAGNGPFAYSYSGLPTGCASANTHRLSCTPSIAGSFAVSVTATDAVGETVYDSLNLTVYPRPTVAFFDVSPQTITLGAWINLTTFAVGGEIPFSFAYSNLPPGCLSVDISTFSCQPAQTGQYTIRVQVTDSLNVSSADAQGALRVLARTPPPAPSPVIMSFSPSQNPTHLGSSVTLTVALAGATSGWSYLYRGLPQGCTSRNASILTCVPSSVGIYNVTVNVSGSPIHYSTAWTLLTVAAASNSTSPPHLVQATAWGSLWWIVGLALLGGVMGGIIVGRYLARNQGQRRDPASSPPSS